MENFLEDQYREKLSEKFSEIMRIDAVFHELKNSAENDYNQGIIDFDTYQEVKNATYYTLLSNKCKNYALTPSERLLVLKYGKFMDNGELSLNGLEDVYTEIIGRYDNVANSVKNYYYFYNLSLEELRNKVIEFVKEYTLNKKEEIECKIATLREKEKELKPVERPKNIYNIEIKQLKKEIEKTETEEKKLINSVMAVDHDILMNYVCKKLSINENFYKWYRVRKNKEKLKNGEFNSIDLSDLNGSRVKAVTCMTCISTAKELIDHIVAVNGWINDFAVQSSTINNDIDKRHSIGKLYNKEECFMLFKKFYDINTFLNYLPSYLDNDDNLSDVDIFNIFYLEHFMDCKKVDPDKFRMTLVKSVFDYYNLLVLKYSSILKDIIGKSLGNIEQAVDCNIKVTTNVVLIKDAISDVNDNTDYLNGYLSNEEEEEVYESLNMYFEEMEKMVKGEAKKIEYGKKSSN